MSIDDIVNYLVLNDVYSSSRIYQFGVSIIFVRDVRTDCSVPILPFPNTMVVERECKEKCTGEGIVIG
jgi:hypothetical protein